MTDKEKIRAEIERIKNNCDLPFIPYTYGKFDLCNHLLCFIDSMPAGPASEDLVNFPVEGEYPYVNPSDTMEGEIDNIWNKLSVNGTFTATKEGFAEVVRHFANWGTEHVKKSQEILHVPETYKENGDSFTYQPTGDDLEEAATKYATHVDFAGNVTLVGNEADAFKTGAQWQKKAILDRACEWLKINASVYFTIIRDPNFIHSVHFLNDKFLEDFRCSMEEDTASINSSNCKY